MGVRPGSVQVGLAKTQGPCAGSSSARGRIREGRGARDICTRSTGRLRRRTVGSIVSADDARKGLWMRGSRGSLLAMDGGGGRRRDDASIGG